MEQNRILPVRYSTAGLQGVVNGTEQNSTSTLRYCRSPRRGEWNRTVPVRYATADLQGVVNGTEQYQYVTLLPVSKA